MADARSGLAAVIADGGPLAIDDQAEELDLFGDDPGAGSPIEGSARALRGACWPAEPGSRRDQAIGAIEQVRPARRGRPAGKQNLRTEAIKAFLLQRYRHPLLGLFDVSAMNPVDLARLMAPAGEQLTREDLRYAWEFWRKCVVDAADFVAPREPRALTLTPGSAPLMSINLMTDQLTMAGVTHDQAGTLGMPESAMNSMIAEGMGGEVLDGEVLEPAISAGKSNE